MELNERFHGFLNLDLDKEAISSNQLDFDCTVAPINNRTTTFLLSVMINYFHYIFNKSFIWETLVCTMDVPKLRTVPQLPKSKKML